MAETDDQHPGQHRQRESTSTSDRALEVVVSGPNHPEEYLQYDDDNTVAFVSKKVKDGVYEIEYESGKREDVSKRPLLLPFVCTSLMSCLLFLGLFTAISRYPSFYVLVVLPIHNFHLRVTALLLILPTNNIYYLR